MVSQEGIDTNNKVVMRALQDSVNGFMIISYAVTERSTKAKNGVLTNIMPRQHQEVGINALLADRVVWETWVLSHQNAFVPTDATVCPPPVVGCVGCVVSLL